MIRSIYFTTLSLALFLVIQPPALSQAQTGSQATAQETSPPSLEYSAPKAPPPPAAPAAGTDAAHTTQSQAEPTTQPGAAQPPSPVFASSEPLPLLEPYDDEQELSEQADVKNQRRLPLQGIQQFEITVNMVVVTADKKVIDDKAVQSIGALVSNKLTTAGFAVHPQTGASKIYPHLTVYALGETASARPRMDFVIAVTDIVRLLRQPDRAYETIIWKRSAKRLFTPDLNAQAEFDRLTDALILDLIAANPRVP